MNYKTFIKSLLNEATKEEIRKFYPKISDEDYNNIIDADPNTSEGKVGTDSRTVLGLFSKDNFDTKDKELLHDIYSALVLYNNSKNILKGQYSKYKDINKIDKVDTFFKVYHFLENNKRKDKLGKDEGNSVIKVFENDNWVVYIPLDYQTSIKLGRMLNASWCTASSTSNHMYNQYITNGDLWIFKNKNPKTDSDIGYQYARAINYAIEFKNNKNSCENTSNDNYWFKFREDNPDLKPVFDEIKTYESNFKSDPQYKIKKYIERYNTSKSPFIALSILKIDRKSFDLLNIDKLEMRKLIPINETMYTTLDYEKNYIDYKHNFVPGSKKGDKDYGFNQYGVGLFIQAGLYGLFDIYDKEVMPANKERIHQFSNKGYIVSTSKGIGTIEDMSGTVLYNFGSVPTTEETINLSNNSDDDIIATITVRPYEGDVVIRKLKEDGSIEEENIKEFMNNIFSDSKVLFKGESSLIVYEAPKTKITDLIPVAKYFGFANIEKIIINDMGVESDSLEFVVIHNNLFIGKFAEDFLISDWNYGRVDQMTEFYESLLFGIVDRIKTNKTDLDNFISFVKSLLTNETTLIILYLIENKIATKIIMEIVSNFDDDTLINYKEEIKNFVENRPMSVKIDVENIFKENSNFIISLSYLKGDLNYYVEGSNDDWRNSWENLFNQLKLKDYELYLSVMNRLRQIAIETELIDDFDDDFDIEDAIGNDDDLRYLINHASLIGQEVGETDEIINQYKRQFPTLTHDDKDNYFLDVEFRYLDDYLKYLINEELEDLDLADLQEPRYGFEGYNFEAAYEQFTEDLNDLTPLPKPKTEEQQEMDEMLKLTDGKDLFNN